MPRYQLAAEGDDFGQPKRPLAMVRTIRDKAKRDGKGYRWVRPDHHETRLYHGATVFSLGAARQMRAMDAGQIAHFQTRIGSHDPVRHYKVRKIHTPHPDTLGERAYAAAMTELGTVYRFGAANGPEDFGPDSFDCSGLTQWAYQQAGGPTLPHSADMQRTDYRVRRFYDVHHARRGDLVFMNFPNGRGIYPPHASHVGLFSAQASTKTPATMLDTRNPDGEPVAIRTIELGNVVAFGRVQG